MATPSQRRIEFDNTRFFGSQTSNYDIPDLTILQTRSYEGFLQEDVPTKKRKNQGLEAVLREIFPISSHDGQMRLEYLYYELEKPRYTPDECRQLRLTYGKPFKVRLRLYNEAGAPPEKMANVASTKLSKAPEGSFEEDVYLGDIPIMLGGGEFIINGAERVVVSQLHRSPGIDFVTEMDTDRKIYSCRIIPERGSWIELNITRKETLSIKIDQSSKLPIMMFLRAMSSEFSSNSQILRAFFPYEPGKGPAKPGVIHTVSASSADDVANIENTVSIENLVYPKGSENAGELIIEAGEVISKSKAEQICAAGLKKIDVMGEPKNKLILNSLNEDKSRSHEEALAKIYLRLRPGNPPQLDKAKELFNDKFFDTNRYRLGRVGRFRINRKLNTNITDSNITEFTGLWNLETWNEKKGKKGTLKEWEEVAGFWEHFHRAPRKTDDKSTKKSGDEKVANVDFVYIHNRKECPEPSEMLLLPDDILHAVLYLSRLWGGDRTDTTAYSTIASRALQKDENGEASPLPLAEIDDIDHLGNRRLRTIDELASEELRKGFLKLRRTVQERLNAKTVESARSCVNQKSISAAIEYFFGRGELSQVVDQTNPLSMLTHERRLSALGPGGLNRKRAGFDVRDVHSSHYGRICPIETPEGTNIGLISSLSIYATVDEFGFLVSPYRRVVNGKLTEDIDWLRADQEHRARLAPSDVEIKDGHIVPDPISETVIVRYDGDYEPVPVEDVEYIDVAPSQMIGVSAGLIPFLEHDDANRALMGSNMQRQAVPLLISENPLVATGLEEYAAFNSSLLIHAQRGGVVSFVDAQRIIISPDPNTVELIESDLSKLKLTAKIVSLLQAANVKTVSDLIVSSEAFLKKQEGISAAVLKDIKKVLTANGLSLDMSPNTDWRDEYVLRKFVGMNERTCQNQVPIIKPGEKVATGQIIADGASMHHGKLCLGRNVLVAFMAWDGFNFEDAIIISEDLVKKDTYTSIHIEEFDVEIRDTKLGREEFTKDIPNVGERALRNLDDNGIIRVGTYVTPGDILVGKVTPKNKTELSPEEKLLHAIFGRAGEDVKNESLEVPSGIEGIVIGTQKFACRMSLSEDERKSFDNMVKKVDKEEEEKIFVAFRPMVAEFEKILDRKLSEDEIEHPRLFRLEHLGVEENDPLHAALEKAYLKFWPAIEAAMDAKERKINSMKRGDELRRGVLQMVKVYVAAKRVISVGDKMAGRHGNKGVIAKILPKEDMPFLEDGTPIEIMLNPLGVPSRMNVGQILETHLGWAAAKLGYQAITPVFDGATEEEINDELEKAGLPRHGKVRLYDGRTGEPFDQETTVGYIYMLKLHHLVDDKVHARSTGPYSLITQQPLGGKARFGGQRFGEMEVWALEAYGAAYMLQELLTVKSDDVEGRTKIYESMVKGENTLEAGTPASFDVLTNEIRGLALNMQLEKTGGGL